MVEESFERSTNHHQRDTYVRGCHQSLRIRSERNLSLESWRSSSRHVRNLLLSLAPPPCTRHLTNWKAQVSSNGLVLINPDSAITSLETLLELRLHAPHLLSNPSRFTVILDGGIRRGTDILKALCLGAHGCSTARPFMFSLPYGEEGIVKCGEILREELERSCRLLGVTRLDQLGETFVNKTRLERNVYGAGDSKL